jgi:hypothetical protein
MGQPCAALVGLLFGALASSAASAGRPVDVTGHSALGDGRFHASVAYAGGARHSERREGTLYLRLGPNGHCFDVVPSGQFKLNLLGPGSLLAVKGGLQSDPRGIVLDPDPAALRDALAERIGALCEEEHGALACAERFAGLEPRLGRTRLSLKVGERRDGRHARLLGRLELLFIDPASERAEVRARFKFRDAGGLTVVPPPNLSGVCITTIRLGD